MISFIMQAYYINKIQKLCLSKNVPFVTKNDSKTNTVVALSIFCTSWEYDTYFRSCKYIKKCKLVSFNVTEDRLRFDFSDKFNFAKGV